MGCGKSSEGVKPVLIIQDNKHERGPSSTASNKIAQEKDETASKEDGYGSVTCKPSYKPLRVTDLFHLYRPSEHEPILRLEYIYGYNSTSRNSVFYLSTSDIIVYPCGSLTVLLSINSNTQRFFCAGPVHKVRGHLGQVVAVAVSKDRDLIATGERGESPVVCMWKLPGTEPVKVIEVVGHTRGTDLIAFAGDTKSFVTVDLSQEQTIRVYDVKTGDLLFRYVPKAGRILSLHCHPKQSSFCTIGPGHFFQWTSSNDSEYSQAPTLSVDDPRSMTFARYFPNGDLVTTCTAGKVYHWAEGSLVRELAVLPTNCPVTALFVSEKIVLVAGKTNKIHMLDSNFTETRVINAPGTPTSLDMSGGSIICGTSDGLIVEFGRTGRTVLMDVHSSGHIVSACLDPVRPGVVLSAGMDNRIKSWDLSHRKCAVSGILEVEDQASGSTAIAASPKGHIAIGHEDGHFTVRMNSYQLNNIVAVGRGSGGSVVCLRYKSDGSVLAVGKTSGQTLMYSVRENYKLIHECEFHRSRIVSLDWSRSGSFLRSQDITLQTAYWKLSSGKQVSAAFVHSETWATDSQLRNTGSELIPLAGARSPVTDVFVQGTTYGVMEMYSSEGKPGPTGYKVHSVETSGIVWAEDGQCVISVGGSDLSLAQWRLA